MVVILKKGSALSVIQNLIESLKKRHKGFNAHKFCGAIKLKENPIDIQKKMRNEWD